MRRALAVAVTLLPVLAAADEVWLEGGGRLQGVVVEETAERVVIEAGPGRITLPRSRVIKVVATHSALEQYRERAAALRADDVAGWVALARWAAREDLGTQASEAYAHVLTIEPDHAAANEALGRVNLGGRWVSAEEAYRARGYVQLDGLWMTPQEHRAALEARSAEAAARAQQIEAEARLREAQARARAAEAEAAARAAAAEAARSQDAAGGIPYGWGYGGGSTVVVVRERDRDRGHERGRPHHAPHDHPRERPHPQPRPTPPPAPPAGFAERVVR